MTMSVSIRSAAVSEPLIRKRRQTRGELPSSKAWIWKIICFLLSSHHKASLDAAEINCIAPSCPHIESDVSIASAPLLITVINRGNAEDLIIREPILPFLCKYLAYEDVRLIGEHLLS